MMQRPDIYIALQVDQAHLSSPSPIPLFSAILYPDPCINPQVDQSENGPSPPLLPSPPPHVSSILYPRRDCSTECPRHAF